MSAKDSVRRRSRPRPYTFGDDNISANVIMAKTGHKGPQSVQRQLGSLTCRLVRARVVRSSQTALLRLTYLITVQLFR
ncbi:hypothetical protein [Actinocrispum wychmicini]|uniref:hypothetical protein n=1 Tax=Actinocrispum wychmicini TaxID=1213861 RepID=UPI00104E50B8|nr:hypothetical protein [Actinocrispum wychmicini]